MDRHEFWGRYLRIYDHLNEAEEYRHNIKDAVRCLGVGPDSLVLDAGSGTGNLAVELEKAGARVVGLDLMPEALRIHRGKQPAAALVQASLGSPLPFASQTFDAVACLSVLFALPPKAVAQTLREFRRVLKPGGVLVLTAMRPGESKVKAYAGFLMGRLAKRPVSRALYEVSQLIWPLLQLLYYNLRMYRLARRNGYRRFSAQELVAEVRRGGLVIKNCETTFGGCFNMLTAKPGRLPQSFPLVRARRQYRMIPPAAAREVRQTA